MIVFAQFCVSQIFTTITVSSNSLNIFLPSKNVFLSSSVRGILFVRLIFDTMELTLVFWAKKKCL